MTFIHCTTRCHSSRLVVIRCHLCHSLSLVVLLVVTRCHLLYHSLSFVVTCCTTRCRLLSLDVPLGCLFINDLPLTSVFNFTNSTFIWKKFQNTIQFWAFKKMIKKMITDYHWATIFAKHPLLVTSTSVTLDLGYSLMINYKHFHSKYCESLRVRINKIEFFNLTRSPTAQRMKFSIKDLLYWRDP